MVQVYSTREKSKVVTGLPLSFFELGVRTPGGLFWAHGTPRVSIAGGIDFLRFRTPRLPILGIMLGLLEMIKMYISCSRHTTEAAR